MADVAEIQAESATAVAGRWRVVSGIVAVYFVFGLTTVSYTHLTLPTTP